VNFLFAIKLSSEFLQGSCENIYKLFSNSCFFPLILLDRVPFVQWFAPSLVFSGYSTHKTDYHDIAELLFKVALSTVYITPPIHNNISLCTIFYFLLKCIISWSTADLLVHFRFDSNIIQITDKLYPVPRLAMIGIKTHNFNDD
jgi:hypothetical protein